MPSASLSLRLPSAHRGFPLFRARPVCTTDDRGVLFRGTGAGRAAKRWRSRDEHHMPRYRVADPFPHRTLPRYDRGTGFILVVFLTTGQPNEDRDGKCRKATISREPEESRMHDIFRCHRDGTATHCAICERPFGLIRHYSWRTPLCSKKCVERFAARRNMDRSWLFWMSESDGPRSSAAPR